MWREKVIVNSCSMMRKRLLIPIFVISLNAWSYDIQSGGLNYNLTSDSTVTVTSQNAGYNDGSIGFVFDSGYAGDVVIPETVTVDGKTYTVTAIQPGAFNNSTQLTSVSIPKTVVNMGLGTFASCPKLTTIVVADDNPTFTAIDDVLYDKDLTTVISCAGAKSGDYSTPTTVSLIAWAAFWGCEKLTSVTLTEGVMEIQSYAFRGCKGIKTMSIPEGVSAIHNGTFFTCRKLQSIQLPSTLLQIGNSAFLGCSNLTEISFPESCQEIGENAFEDCMQLQELTFPSSLTKIGFRAFANCSQIEQVSIPATVTEIGMSVFSGCTNLQSIDVSPDNAYYKSVEGVLFDHDVTLLINYPTAREGAYVMPPTVTTIGTSAFYLCMNMTAIKLSPALETIGDAAFLGCYGLTELKLPHRVNNIGFNAFGSCMSLTSITAYPIAAPTITVNTFSTDTYSVPLYIPIHYRTAYTKHSIWKQFTQKNNIVECMTATTEESFPNAVSTLSMEIVSSETDIHSYQCVLTLPEGMQLLTDEEGTYLFNVPSFYEGNAPEVTVTCRDDGSYLLTCTLADGCTLYDNEGMVLQLPLSIGPEVAVGSCVGTISDAFILCAHNKTLACEPSEFTIEVEEGVKGDVNRDGIVNITDVMLCANYAVGQNVSTFVRPLADMNNDTQISITDIMQIVNIVVSGE